MTQKFVSIEELFGDSHWKHAKMIEEGKFVSAAQLAAARKRSPDGEPPQIILDYEAKLAAGKIKNPGGRPSNVFKAMRRQGRFIVAANLYYRYLPWLQQHKERIGAIRQLPLARAEWWELPPCEIAVLMVRRRLKLGHVTPEYLATEIYRHRAR